MEKVHFRATWSPEEGLFKIKFQVLYIEHGKEIPGSPAFWDVKDDQFLKMVERAEQDLLVKDGQNKLRSNYLFQFIDKVGNDCQIALSNTDRDTFRQITEYLRKVYDSWFAWKNQPSKN